MFNYVLKKIVGTKNDRELKRLWPLVARVGALEPKMQERRDDWFPTRTAELKEEVARGRPLEEVMPEAFAMVREAAVRALGMRHFDVQLIGGAVLHSGRIAEMKTGEGKTLVATLPVYLNALSQKGVHVVTVNDYLARRDAEWMGRIYKFLGLTVGCNVHGLTEKEKQDAYRSDVTYGQNNEFGFDYLRDNMKFRLSDYAQRELHYAIVDEVDSILIDEARTPLIISGPAEVANDLYYQIDRVIPSLVRDTDYTVDEKNRSVSLNDEGVEKLEKKLAVQNLYDPDQIETLHHIEQALRAHTLYKRDRDYVVKDGQVLIVDEFTGRILAGRRWSDGLHQAVEAKEGVTIENENQTLATISFQNYFRMYSKLAGMTGTADTEAEEFGKIYELDVTVVPTNRDMIRADEQDTVYKTEREKFTAVAEQLKALHQKGQPVLVGTVSIAKSEAVSNFLKKQGIPHHVLNAKQHEREAEFVAQAGRAKSVTISTNMAGRGTDIILGGNPDFLARAEVGKPPDRASVAAALVKDPKQPSDKAQDRPPTPAQIDEALRAAERQYDEAMKAAVEKYKKQCAEEREQVLQAGGLFILGTERHESRRIDNQLRGRAGRQGDPGQSKFYLSLEDDLMRIFASERIAKLMDTFGVQENEPIEHPWLSKAIEGAQKRVEGQNFDIRKHLLEYDDVMNQQRKTIYGLRREVLASGSGMPLVEFKEDPKDKKKKIRSERMVEWNDQRERILDMFEERILDIVAAAVPKKSSEAWDPKLLRDMVREQFNVDINFQGAKIDPEAIAEQIYNVVEKAYVGKEESIGADSLRRFEQYVLLSTIDTLWKDHLLTMDHLRQGIGLRGYAQKDPKLEYKKEGHELFSQMMGRITASVVSTLMRVQLREEAAEEAEAALARRRPQRTVESHGEAPAKPQTVTRSSPKVGRNDPCPCGSGKKYKKCHGMTEGATA